eukprot:scaffold41117_cov60-Phaeocystis_antarctica.AAC.1
MGHCHCGEAGPDLHGRLFPGRLGRNRTLHRDPRFVLGRGLLRRLGLLLGLGLHGSRLLGQLVVCEDSAVLSV